MLYDPKWEVPTKTDPFTIGSLISWLETKNPREKYDYMASDNCALCQYFRAMGFKNVKVRGWTWADSRGEHQLPPRFNDAVHQSNKAQDWTFGNALRWARDLVD